MNARRLIAAAVVALTLIGACLLLIDRGGLIAWVALVLGALLAVKIWVRSSRHDPVLSIGLALAATMLWVGVFYVVIATYESGEVVELTIETDTGSRSVSLWVMEQGTTELAYYDADPAAAASLLAGKPLQFTRGGETSLRVPSTRLAESLTDVEASEVFELMRTKYGDRMRAADLYYLLLGVPRDRQALIVRFVKT